MFKLYAEEVQLENDKKRIRGYLFLDDVLVAKIWLTRPFREETEIHVYSIVKVLYCKGKRKLAMLLESCLKKGIKIIPQNDLARKILKIGGYLI